MKYIYIILAITLFTGCSGDDVDPVPTASTLLFPINNQECNQGIDVPGTSRSKVTFSWQASTNTDEYNLVLKNLNTSTTTSHSVVTNELAIEIEKGTPYSWSVTSKLESTTETAQSETWKFYNAGDPIESHTPFPADLVAPVMGSALTGISNVTLSWQGNDIDNDIVNYDIYFGTITPPTSQEGSTTGMTMDFSVSSGNTYYWRIITSDSQGNNSQSEIFEFKVN